MSIAPFQLPSDPEIEIKIREATVQDALTFSSLNTDKEQALLSEFLNTIQLNEAYRDSRNWTASDRISVFFWYAINTMPDTSMSLSYQCPHCQEVHAHRYDVRDLANNYQLITGKPVRDLKIKVDGFPVRVKPLNGHAMEGLENLRLNGASDSELKLQELLLHIDFYTDKEEGESERENKKASRVSAMPMTDYDNLCNEVAVAVEDMRHGIPVTRDDKGVTNIVTGSQQCPNKEEGATTTLHAPFRDIARIPVV